MNETIGTRIKNAPAAFEAGAFLRLLYQEDTQKFHLKSTWTVTEWSSPWPGAATPGIPPHQVDWIGSKISSVGHTCMISMCPLAHNAEDMPAVAGAAEFRIAQAAEGSCRP